ncbi:MAG: NAD-dependent epimerase/dehydratase family protein [Prevotella sp.]|nr:NAD-dependent epimerase/dehydratase family protein [Prevotella sp.]MCM1075670.1 NAD-dependent epimerase/dehydratase family protein [Ruminococcus sp.]
MTEIKDILVTGATGFIGGYIMERLEGAGYKPDVLSRKPGVAVVCDLENDVPELNKHYDIVVHAAGTDEFSRADALNNEGTKRLLRALEGNMPGQIIFLSTVNVYGKNPGEDVEETCFLRPDTPYSRSKIRAEKSIEKWCEQHGVMCTILRPAATVGRGMHGRLVKMADKVSRGYYMHLRGNEGVRSLVMADDVANAVAQTFGVPGVFNVTDGLSHSVIAIADAMAANFNSNKRILSLSSGLVNTGLKLFPVVGLKRLYAELTAKATFSNKKISAVADFQPYNTLEVMARKHPDYPYKE